MNRARVLVILAGALASACGLLVDPGRHVGAGTDGSVDDVPQLPLPTAPTVSITPASPTTTDALEAHVDVESVDPAGRPITYEHAWLRDGADAGVAAPRVEPTATRKGETWTVRVTPVTDDGRRGPPGEAEVTVINSAPALMSVGLSSYRPVLNDGLIALPCGATDPDGDRPRVELTWRIDGAPAAVTGSRVVLTSALVSPGSEIELEAVAIDDEGARSEVVRVGPAIVVDDVTRWVQLLPDTARIVHSMHDPARCRVLHAVEEEAEVQLWEHLPDEGRWVQLRPEGAPAGQNWPLILPDGTGRFYLIGETRVGPESGVFRVVELDARERGREVWREVELDGERPTDSSVLSGLYDPERGAPVFATAGTTGVEIWTVEVADRATLTRHTSAAAPGAFASTWVRVPGTRRVMAFGGVDLGSGGLGGAPNDLVHELDLDDLAAGFVERAERLPAPAAVPTAILDEARGRVIVGFGFGDGLALASHVSQLELASGTFADFDVPGGPPTALFGFVSEERGRVLVYPRFTQMTGPGVPDLYRLDLATDTWEPVLVTGRDHPRPLVGAIGGFFADDLVLYGGVDPTGRVSDELWRAGVAGGADFRRVVRVDPTPDPSAGVPGPRWGVALAAELSRLVVVGGRDGPMSTDLADTEVWELAGDAWRRRALGAGAVAPDARYGPVVTSLPGGCGGDLALVGGETSAGASSDVITFACGADCTWTTESTTGSQPARYYAAVGPFGASEVIIVGGWGAHGAATAYDPCTRAFRALTIEGDPFERIEHTIDRDLVFGGADPEAFVPVPVNTVQRIVRVDADTVRFDLVTVATDGDGEPAPRTLHVSGYDEERARLFVYGGGAGSPRSDLWMLRLR